MKQRSLIVILLVSVIALPLLAQSNAPATREDVLKLFDVMKIHDQMNMVMKSVASQQHTMMRESMRKRFPQITDKELARLDQFSSDIMKDLPIDGMLDDMIPVYQKHLSKNDVDAMSAFYSSPTGQKLLTRDARHDRRIHAGGGPAHSGHDGQGHGTSGENGRGRPQERKGFVKTGDRQELTCMSSPLFEHAVGSWS